MSFKELKIVLVKQSHMPVSNVASDWPRAFLHPRCFCLAYELQGHLAENNNIIIMLVN